MYANSRSKNKEDIKIDALYYIKSDDLNIEYRFSALVAYLYKCIETDDLSGVLFAREWGGVNKENLKKKLGLKKRGVRDDPMQVFISYLTVMWHASIFIQESPMAELNEIKNLVCTNDLLKASYSQNIGRSLLIMSYIFFLNEEYDEVKDVACCFYSYYLRLFRSLDEAKPIGSSHFGDITKCAAALHCALGGYEWVAGRRELESQWNEKRVIGLSSRISDPGFRKKMNDFLSGKSAPARKLICVGIRYSLYTPGTQAYHIASGSELDYKKNLFSEERLSVREEIFKSITLPSLRRINEANSTVGFLVVIVISKELPLEYKQRLYGLIKDDDFIEISEQGELGVDVNKALLSSAERKLSGDKALVATSRLDDDDALSITWFESLENYMDICNVGNIVTFPHGVTGFYDEETKKIIAAVEVDAANIALGLSNVLFFDGAGFSGDSIYKQGNHMNHQSEKVYTSDYAFFRVINSYRDKNYIGGKNRNRLRRDFKNYASRFKRVLPDLGFFGINLDMSEVDDFVAFAKMHDGKIVVDIKADTLSRKYEKYKSAIYFLRGNDILKKISYEAGSRREVKVTPVLEEADHVRIYLLDVECGSRCSIKVPIFKG